MTTLNNFSNRLAQLIESAKNIVLNNNTIETNKGCDEILNAVRQFCLQLPKSEFQNIQKIAENMLCDDNTFYEESLNNVETMIFALLFNNDEFKEMINIDLLNISLWEQLEDNDLDWVASQVNIYLLDDLKSMFLLETRLTDTTETNIYALYSTRDPKSSKIANIAYAQAFLGGELDKETEQFYFGSSFQAPSNVYEIDEQEFQAYARLGFRKYEELDSISYNKDAVQQYIELNC